MTSTDPNLKGPQAATSAPPSDLPSAEPAPPAASPAEQDPAALAKQLQSAPLPTLTLPFPASAIVDALDKLARRGKLAGFSPITPAAATKAPAGALFSIAAFGNPFDAVLYAAPESAPQSQPTPSTRLTFTRKLKLKGLIFFGLILLLTIWPGIELTRSLLASTFPEQRWLIDTLPYWYLPLTIISLPWGLWEAWRRSNRSSHLAAHIAIAKLSQDIPGAALDS
jgi:hypothetical protein